MTDTREKVKSLIGSSAKVLVATEVSADEASTFASLALKDILEGAGKHVFLFPQTKESLAKKFEGLLPEKQGLGFPQKIKIKIPKSSPIEEVGYEEEGDFLSLIIAPKSRLEPESILIEKSPHEMDMAFCFFSNDEGWKKISAPVTKPPPEKVVYFSSGEKTLAEKIKDVYETINDSSPLPGNTATLLYASLVYETDNFQIRQGAQTFALAKKLLDAGADKKILDKALSEEKKTNLVQLVGRALARTASEEESGASWTFLTKQDFLKTGLEASKENILFILRKVRSQISWRNSSVVCYESGNGIDSLVFHENEGVLKKLSLALGASPESRYFFVSGFKNFSEAESKIKELLRENLSARMNSNG